MDRPVGMGAAVPTIQARAPLKAIISGEHAVVYGHPCVAAALTLCTIGRLYGPQHPNKTDIYSAPVLIDVESGQRVASSKSLQHAFYLIGGLVSARAATAQKEAQDGSYDHGYQYMEIAVYRWALGKGLGSSASILAAYTALLLSAHDAYSPELAFDIALVGETHVHGKTSGMDLRTVIYGGIQLQNCTAQHGAQIAGDLLDRYNLSLLIADSGEPKSTSRAIAHVASSGKTDVLSNIGSVTSQIIALLDRASNADADRVEFCTVLASLIAENHSLLCELGINTGSLDGAHATLLSAGCYAAKIIGAGLGGCCLGLCSNELSVEYFPGVFVFKAAIGGGLSVTLQQHTLEPV